MMAWLAVLKKVRPWMLGVAALAAVIAWQQFQLVSARTALADCRVRAADVRSEFDVLRASHESLASHVDHQNAEIARYEEEILSRDVAVRDAERRVAAALESARRDIAELQERRGSSCREGVELIDEELGL